MGLWPRLLARLLACGSRLLSACSKQVFNQSSVPSRIKTWREGVYFEWKSSGGHPAPFVLVQSGSEEYDLARKIPTNNTDKESSDYVGDTGSFKYLSWENGQKEKGLEIVVPRSQAGVVSRFFILMLVPISDGETLLVALFFVFIYYNVASLGQCTPDLCRSADRWKRTPLHSFSVQFL